MACVRTIGGVNLATGVATGLSGLQSRQPACAWRTLTAGPASEAVPAGRDRPWVLALRAGGMGATVTGTASVVADVRGSMFLAAALAGSSDLTASSLTLDIRLAPAIVTGQGNLAAAMNSPAHLVCRIKIGADPGAEEIADAVWQRETTAHTDSGVMGGLLALLGKLARNKTVTDPTTGTITVYDDDGVTPLLTAALFQDVGGTTAYAGAGADRRDRLE